MMALKTGKPVQGIYMPYKTARGRLVETLNHAFPLYYEEELVGAICFTTDVLALTKMTKNQTLTIQEETTEKTGRSAPVSFDKFIGKNPTFREAVDMAKVAAKGPSSVMLVGETGTGKDLFARAIHEGGPAIRKRIRLHQLLSHTGDTFGRYPFRNDQGSVHRSGRQARFAGARFRWYYFSG